MCSSTAVCLAALLSLCSTAGVAATPDTLRLTLDDCLRTALETSPAAVESRLDSVAAAGSWREVSGMSYPQLRLSGDLPSLREASDYSIYYDPQTDSDVFSRVSSGDEMWLGRLALEQDLPWGATMSFSSRLYSSRWHNDRIAGGRDTLEYALLRRVQLTQPLLQGNPVGRRRKIGKLSWKSALIEREIDRRDIRYRTKQAFFGLVSARGALDIARQDLRQGRDAEELARRKLQAGLIPEVELLQIQVDLARREGSFRQVRARAEAAGDRLLVALGLPLETPVEPLWEPPDDIPQQVPADTSGERLELAGQQLTLEQKRLETRAAAWTERVNISLLLYFELEHRQNEFNRLGGLGDRNRGVVLSLEMPLFGFGKTSGRVQRLKAQYLRARTAYRAARDQFAAELREALRTVQQAADRIRIAAAALELSRRGYDMSVGRFDSGLINSRELLDAQLDLTRTRTELLNARIDYELAVANLERIAPVEDLAGIIGENE